MSKSKSSERSKVAKDIGIRIAGGVGTAVTLGVIGSVITGNPVPLLAAFKAGAVVGSAGAAASGGNN